MRAKKHLLFYQVAIGGMDVGSIDQPILAAIDDIQPFAKPNAQIVIVAPASISAETEKLLHKKGILIERIEFSIELYKEVSDKYFVYGPNTIEEAMDDEDE